MMVVMTVMAVALHLFSNVAENPCGVNQNFVPLSY
jgi:hypothetical protein